MQIKEVNVIFVALLLFGQEQMATRWEELRRREREPGGELLVHRF